MPIYRLLQNMPMGLRKNSRLTTATSKHCGLAASLRPIAEMAAKKIIEIGQLACIILRISTLAIKGLGCSRPPQLVAFFISRAGEKRPQQQGG
jgi:hypothetical protein